mgnify:CR=1 FL=1
MVYKNYKKIKNLIKILHQKLLDNLITTNEEQQPLLIVSKRNRRKHKQH